MDGITDLREKYLAEVGAAGDPDALESVASPRSARRARSR